MTVSGLRLTLCLMAKPKQSSKSRAASGHIRVGVGGWSYAPWRGVFYPKGLKQADELCLRHEQAHLDRDQRHPLPPAKPEELPHLGRHRA